MPFIYLFIYLWIRFVCLSVPSRAITTLFVAVFHQVLYLAMGMRWPDMLWFLFSVAPMTISKYCRFAEMCETIEGSGGKLQLFVFGRLFPGISRSKDIDLQ